MPGRDGSSAASPSPLQPSAEEYAVFLNRFKLLNLVQRVAHNDVMELVETVGLDALTCKGFDPPKHSAGGLILRRGLEGAADVGGESTSQVGGRTRRTKTARAGRTPISQRTVTTPTATPPSPSAAAATVGRAGGASAGYRPRRTNQDVRAEAAAAALRSDANGDGRESDVGRRHRPLRQRQRSNGVRGGYGFRSREERDAYYARLAEPRQRLGLELDEGGGDYGYGYEDGIGDQRDASRFRRGGQAGEGHSLSAEQVRSLFSEFLRSRYGRDGEAGAAEGGAQLPSASASGDALSPKDGSTPPWRQLQSYDRGGGAGLMQGYPPSSTWPPHAATGDDALASFYRAQQLLHDPTRSSADSSGAAPNGLGSSSNYPQQGPHTTLRQNSGGASVADPLMPQPAKLATGNAGSAGVHGQLSSSNENSMKAATQAAHLSASGFEQHTDLNGNNTGNHESEQLISLVKTGSPNEQHDGRGSSIFTPNHLGAVAATFQAALQQQQALSEGGLLRPPASPLERVATAPSPSSDTLPRSAVNPNLNSLSSQSQGQMSITGMGGAAPRVMGGGRGLAPKAKPPGALDSPRVPMGVVQHAAAMLSSLPRHTVLNPSGAEQQELLVQQQQGASASDNAPSRSVYFASTTRDGAAVAEGGLASRSGPDMGLRQGWADQLAQPQQQPQAQEALFPREQPEPVNTRALAPSADPRQAASQPPPPSLVAIAASIDRMLHDHQRILDEVVRERGREKNLSAEVGDSHQTSGSSEDSPPVDGSSSSGDAVDEMLTFAQLQRKVDAMDHDMARIQATTGLSAGRCEPGNEDEGYADEDNDEGVAVSRAGTKPSGNGSKNRNQTEKPQPQPRPRRQRGTIPEAVVRRLLSYQVEQHECVAYNEKLWNTSALSQYAFAQRLTNALLEDCFEEVTREVAGIMDEYVDGLADHELQ